MIDLLVYLQSAAIVGLVVNAYWQHKLNASQHQRIKNMEDYLYMGPRWGQHPKPLTDEQLAEWERSGGRMPE